MAHRWSSESAQDQAKARFQGCSSGCEVYPVCQEKGFQRGAWEVSLFQAFRDASQEERVEAEECVHRASASKLYPLIHGVQADS